jgi:small-conductance mechanosensitive channel
MTRRSRQCRRVLPMLGRLAAFWLVALPALHAAPLAAATGGRDPPARAESAAPAPAPVAMDVLMSERLEALRLHREAIESALPEAPAEVAEKLHLLVEEEPPARLLLSLAELAAILVLGWLAERLFLRAVRRLRRRVLDASEATVAARVAKVGLRLVLAALSVLVFAAVAFGGFLAFDWPPLLQSVASRFLAATVALLLVSIVVRVLLAPTLPHLRLTPIDDVQARFWNRRLYAFAAIFILGYAAVTSLATLGVSLPARQIVAYLLGLGLVAVTIESVWRRPRAAAGAEAAGGIRPEGDSRHVQGIMAALFAVALWLLWAIDAMAAFTLLLLAGLLPVAIRVAQASVNHLLRPVGSTEDQSGPPTVLAAAIERGVRLTLIVGAACLLAWACGFDLLELSRREAGPARVVGILLQVVVIAMLAEFTWHVAKTAIDRYIHVSRQEAGLDPDEARRRARLRTLLPIIRNVLFIVLLITAVLMALASMGVQIAPLIAGAGVVGVAVGFGAQSIVKDIIAGMFFVLDDAFRVGEYIVSGSVKGTVKSFSLRSVKLRHQRGPLYTVPFGSLGAIENLSRDWVIDKLVLNVTYDTDVEKVRKIVKKVSAEVMEDPEMAAVILDPLKSQGILAMGDFGLQLRTKITTLPGQQFIVRRAILAKIKSEFEQNGIHFALSNVAVPTAAHPPPASLQNPPKGSPPAVDAMSATAPAAAVEPAAAAE